MVAAYEAIGLKGCLSDLGWSERRERVLLGINHIALPHEIVSHHFPIVSAIDNADNRGVVEDLEGY